MDKYLIGFWGLITIMAVIAIIINNIDKRRKAAKRETQQDAAVQQQSTANTSPTPPTPAPVPASASSRSSNWLWLIVGILAIVVVIWVIAPMITKTTSQMPQATAPQKQKQLQQRVIKQDLKFVGGEGAIEKEGLIGIRNGGHAAFTTWNLPWRKDAIYHVVFYVLRKTTTGYDYIEINDRSGNIFCKHFASDKFETVVFFERDMPGDPKYFNPGTNQIKFWSPGDNVIVQSARIEMAYWE